MYKQNKFNIGDHVSTNNEIYSHKGKDCIIIEIDDTYDPTEIAYKVHIVEDGVQTTMKESDLISFVKAEEPVSSVNISLNIKEILPEEKIIELAKEAITKHVSSVVDNAIINRSVPHKHGIVDEIVSNVGMKYADDMFNDPILKEKFENQIKEIIECEINREKPINDNYDLFRQQIEWKLQNFGEQYIKDNPELIAELMKDGLRECAHRVAKYKLTDILKKELENLIDNDEQKSIPNLVSASASASINITVRILKRVNVMSTIVVDTADIVACLDAGDIIHITNFMILRSLKTYANVWVNNNEIRFDLKKDHVQGWILLGKDLLNEDTMEVIDAEK